MSNPSVTAFDHSTITAAVTRILRQLTSIAKRIAIPVLGIADAAIVMTGLMALILFVAGRAFLGLELPANIPLWAGLLAVLAVVCALTWPVRALRCRLQYAPSDRRHHFTAGEALGQLVLGVIGVAIGLGIVDRFVPGAHDVLVQLPTYAAQTLDAVQAWWVTV